MKALIKLFFLFALSISLITCKKNQTGGNASVSGVVNHHGKPIANARVFIKFKTTDFPGDDYTKYDSYVDADNDGNYKISLYKGSYYLYAKGYDLDIPSPFVVQGGLSFTIRNKEVLTKDIAVSED